MTYENMSDTQAMAARQLRQIALVSDDMATETIRSFVSDREQNNG